MISKPVQILSWNRTSEELIVIMSGKDYVYFDVGPHRYERIRHWISCKNHTELFKVLRACSKPKRLERSTPLWIEPPQRVRDVFDKLDAPKFLTKSRRRLV